MNKIICASDTHLKPWNIRSFVEHVKSTGASGLLLTGDITEGFNFESAIEFLALNLTMPIYFVLGNHDFWGSSTAERYWQTRKLCEKYPNLMWLTESEPVRINKNS